MSQDDIDHWAHAVGAHLNRRILLRILSALGLGSLTSSREQVEARKKKKKKKKDPPQPSPPPPPPPPQPPLPPPPPPIPAGCDLQVSTVPQLLAALATALSRSSTRICLAAGSYDLPPNEFESHDIELSGATLIGAGAEQTILRGSGTPQRSVVANFFEAAMRDLTVTGARSSPGSGGGVSNVGDLTLTNCIIRDNEAGYGGGIFNGGNGVLALDGCMITDNRAVTEDPPRGRGGGVLNFGTINQTSTTISGNSADTAGTDNCFDDGGSGC